MIDQAALDKLPYSPKRRGLFFCIPRELGRDVPADGKARPYNYGVRDARAQQQTMPIDNVLMNNQFPLFFQKGSNSNETKKLLVKSFWDN